jgi:deoxycytidine triphosphate deaminase
VLPAKGLLGTSRCSCSPFDLASGEQRSNILGVPRVLADREIKKLLGSVIQGSEEALINPNGIELRLGEHVRFMSTGEIHTITAGSYLKITPGESALISPFEKIDFWHATVEKVFPGGALMGLITPTTTMMREGIIQAATKIDPGFEGLLNWGLRNSSYKDLIIGHGEPMFKLTLWLLERDEVPDIEYGGRSADKYQHTEGIKISGRRIPADIPKNKIVSSSMQKLDPKKQLREAGYPFDHIGSELIRLDGKFEMVSRDVASLTEKIEGETKSVVGKIEETKDWLVEHVENLFSKKFIWLVGTVIGGIVLLYSLLAYLKTLSLTDSTLVAIAGIGGIII